MSFSVSGSFVIVLLGVFIAAGTVYATLWNTGERLADAEADQRDRLDRLQGTSIAVDSVGLISTVDCGVEIVATNEGETTLALNRTDLLLDNAYESGWRTDAELDDETGSTVSSTDLWFPGEQLRINASGLDAAPERVRLVTGPGVADSTGVDLTC